MPESAHLVVGVGSERTTQCYNTEGLLNLAGANAVLSLTEFCWSLLQIAPQLPARVYATYCSRTDTTKMTGGLSESNVCVCGGGGRH